MSPQLLAVLLAAAQPGLELPAAMVDRWHAALQEGRRETVLELMTPEAVIFESGEAESTRDEYAARHLDADMAFSRTTTMRVDSRQVVELTDAAVVLSRTTTTGTYEGKPVNSRGVETMVLRQIDSGWRIAHIHWSSRRASPLVSATPGPPGR
jgi:uncharacterized protein (TIGR02246 family)